MLKFSQETQASKILVAMFIS